MADPVGIAGTAAGLVSLGLQLYGEISKYISAVKGRKDDLDSARRHAETMQKCIIAIDDAISSFKDAKVPTIDAVETCVNSCMNELKALEAVILSLKGQDAGADTLSSRLKDKGRQVVYPFKRDKLLELEKRMSSTNEVLQTALHAFGINISVATHGVMNSLHTHLAAMDMTAEDTRGRISSLSDTVDEIHTFTDSSGRLVPDIHAQTTLTSVMIAKHTESLLQTTQVAIRIDENTKNIQEEVSQMGRNLERVEEILKGLIETPPETNSVKRQVARLVAKPADLKTMCDAILEPSIMEATASPNLRRKIATLDECIQEQRYCLCTIRKTRSRARAYWGPLSFDTEAHSVLHHSPQCPLACVVPAEHSRNRVFGITVPAIRGLLQMATQVTFSIKSGAGGSSFDLGLKWIATVNPLTSPTFRITKIALDSILSIDARMEDEDSRRFLESCWKRLFLCYAENKASPTDLDPNGMSLLTWLTFQVKFWFYKEFETVERVTRLITSLLPLKVSVNTIDRHGDTSLAAVISSTWLKPCSTVYQTVKALESCGAEVQGEESVKLKLARSPSELVDCIQFVKCYPQIAELLGFGPFATAIIREDYVSINRLSAANPASVNHKNYLGQFPIHIAVSVGNVDILRAVLKYTDAVTMNAEDNDGFCPIDYATCESMHKLCRDKEPGLCNGCAVLDIILCAGCALYPKSLHNALGVGRWHGENPSIIAQQKVIHEVSVRRRGLAQLAANILSRKEMDFLDISDTRMLDSTAGLVQQHLQMRSYLVPVPLQVWDERESPKPDTMPIYAFISNKSSAEFAWRLGFDNIWYGSDILNQVDFALYTDSISRGTDIGVRMAQYITWWLRNVHKAPSPSPRTVKPMAHHENNWSMFHMFMNFIGQNMRTFGKIKYSFSNLLSDAIFCQQHGDKCSCYCSSEGCTPLTMFLKGLLSWLDDPTDLAYNYTLRRRICQKVFGLIPSHRYRSEGYDWIYRSVLRYFTFETLGIRHTCCLHGGSSSMGRLSNDEAREIQKEDEELVELLENLVADFEERCKCNARLMPFLQDCWAPRMCSVIEGFTTNKSEELQAAEEVGVRWEHKDSKNEDESLNNAHKRKLEYWMEKLNDIAPERDIALPPGLKF